jgi:hypothetical protein
MSTTSKSVKQSIDQTEAQPKQSRQDLTVNAAPQLPATNDEALDRHLAKWGGSGGRMFGFNGSTGIFRTLDDNTEIPSGTKFIAFLHETRRGFIKFNGEGVPPDVQMVRIDEDVEDIERDPLGENDRSKWPLGMDGQPADPWKEQIVIPMARDDAGRELYLYVSRGIVAMNSAGDLLGRWRWHPNRAAGLIPVVIIESGTYPSKKFGGRKPKPILKMDRWVTRSGDEPPAQAIARPSLSEELNDKVDF